MTKAAEMLNKVFEGFDLSAAKAAFGLHNAAGGFFDRFMAFISLLGTGGILFVAAGAVMILFRRTRRAGLTVVAAVLLGAIVTNLLLKPLVARPRPYLGGPIRDYWLQVGMHTESDLSFPSGHTTAATAASVAVFLSFRKKYSWPALLFPLLMGVSRVYLMVHYASDVLFGLLAGAGAAVAAYFLIKLLYDKARGKCKALLTEPSVVSLFKREKKEEQGIERAGSGGEETTAGNGADGASRNGEIGGAQRQSAGDGADGASRNDENAGAQRQSAGNGATRNDQNAGAEPNRSEDAREEKTQTISTRGKGV